MERVVSEAGACVVRYVAPCWLSSGGGGEIVRGRGGGERGEVRVEEGFSVDAFDAIGVELGFVLGREGTRGRRGGGGRGGSLEAVFANEVEVGQKLDRY